ncbi:MAG: hypothetical protein ACXVE4_00305 [Solirubrobacteraceae bacterium]
MPEGLSAAEVGKEIAEHREHAVHAEHAGAAGQRPEHAAHATQIRTLDSVSFNAAETAYASGNIALFRVAIKRMRPGYRPAVNAWLALHPLKNRHAPPDPSYMPQYRIPQEAAARVFNAQADASFAQGEAAAGTADKYVRLTVLLAAVLFLVGIGSRFPVRVARYGLVSVAGVLLAISVVQLFGLPGPPP